VQLKQCKIWHHILSIVENLTSHCPKDFLVPPPLSKGRLGEKKVQSERGVPWTRGGGVTKQLEEPFDDRQYGYMCSCQ
jgi:hypothetical protein